jgi:hypothetical protein
MKNLQFTGLIACAAFLAGCETTETTGRGNQEVKRLAAIQQQEQEAKETDEAQRNLWNAHHDVITMDGNAGIRHY